MVNLLNIPISVVSLLAPMTVPRMVYYYLHIGFSAILLAIVAPMEDKFTCAGASNDISSHCQGHYEKDHNNFEQSFYWVNCFLLFFMMLVLSAVIMAKEASVKKSNNCKIHIHHYHFTRIFVFFLIHFVLGGILLGIGNIKLTMNGAFTCVNGNSTFSCVDKLAKKKARCNISLYVNTGLSILYNLGEMLYFAYRWKSKENERSKFAVEPYKCRDCNYFIKKFKRVQGMILI